MFISDTGKNSRCETQTPILPLNCILLIPKLTCKASQVPMKNDVSSTVIIRRLYFENH